jgi:hypothetical protein
VASGEGVCLLRLGKSVQLRVCAGLGLVLVVETEKTLRWTYERLHVSIFKEVIVFVVFGSEDTYSQAGTGQKSIPRGHGSRRRIHSIGEFQRDLSPEEREDLDSQLATGRKSIP